MLDAQENGAYRTEEFFKKLFLNLQYITLYRYKHFIGLVLEYDLRFCSFSNNQTYLIMKIANIIKAKQRYKLPKIIFENVYKKNKKIKQIALY